jgi:hypothetical protein
MRSANGLQERRQPANGSSRYALIHVAHHDGWVALQDATITGLRNPSTDATIPQ